MEGRYCLCSCVTVVSLICTPLILRQNSFLESEISNVAPLPEDTISIVAPDRWLSGHLRPYRCLEVTSIFWVGPIIEATVWQMALVEKVAAVALSAAHHAISTIH